MLCQENFFVPKKLLTKTGALPHTKAIKVGELRIVCNNSKDTFNSIPLCRRGFELFDKVYLVFYTDIFVSLVYKKFLNEGNYIFHVCTFIHYTKLHI